MNIQPFSDAEIEARKSRRVAQSRAIEEAHETPNPDLSRCGAIRCFSRDTCTADAICLYTGSALSGYGASKVDEVTKRSGSIAHGILTEAADIVEGARNSTHGDKERSFQVISDLWVAYLEGRRNATKINISPVDVANMMALLKIARSIQGQPIRDHYVDGAGYLSVAGELSA